MHSHDLHVLRPVLEMKDKPRISYSEIREYSEFILGLSLGVCLSFGIISLCYVMTVELRIDVNIHVCGA